LTRYCWQRHGNTLEIISKVHPLTQFRLWRNQRETSESILNRPSVRAGYAAAYQDQPRHFTLIAPEPQFLRHH
jgi:hypothetical protein